MLILYKKKKNPTDSPRPQEHQVDRGKVMYVDSGVKLKLEMHKRDQPTPRRPSLYSGYYQVLA